MSLSPVGRERERVVGGRKEGARERVERSQTDKQTGRRTQKAKRRQADGHRRLKADRQTGRRTQKAKRRQTGRQADTEG